MLIFLGGEITFLLTDDKSRGDFSSHEAIYLFYMGRC